MLKKKAVYWFIFVLLCSVFPAAKIYISGIEDHVPLQTSFTRNSDRSPENETGKLPDPNALPTDNPISLQDDHMTVHFLDVGQADSVFIDYGTYEILVDGGNNADGPGVADYIKPYIDGNLELVVGTHAHEDHIGGLDQVISAYQTDQIVYSDENASTATFLDFYEAAASEPDCTFAGDSDMIFYMGGGARFEILEMGDGYRDPNENSVVSLIDFNDVEILLTGDLESSVEKKNLTKFSDIDILKVGHHGSRTASSQNFLDVIKPEVSIISAGLDNQYSLPNEDIISCLISMNSKVFGTFRSGNIILTTDGVQYHLNTEIQLTPNDAGAPRASSSATTMRRGCICRTEPGTSGVTGP